MKRIDTATRAVDLFGAGKDGYKDGNKTLGISPTDLNASIFNAIQEEIAGVIEGTGVALVPADNTQLATAIKSLIANGVNDYIARATTTANITLSGLGTQAGGDWSGALTAGDLVLVKDQTTGSQNGWYNVAAGAWTRATFADISAEIKPGVLTQVSEGSTLADSVWILTTDAPITLATTALVFARKDIPIFASNAEAQAFSVTNKVISPATLAAAFQAANQSMAVTGYQKLPGGLIIQWGLTSAIAQSGFNAVTFPVTFPTAVFRVVGSPIVSASNSNVYSVGAYSITTSGFNASNNSGTSGVASMAWIALGY